MGRAQTASSNICGVVDLRKSNLVSRTGLERPTGGSDSLVGEYEGERAGIRSTAGHVESGRNMGGPSPKAKYDLVTDRV